MPCASPPASELPHSFRVAGTADVPLLIAPHVPIHIDTENWSSPGREGTLLNFIEQVPRPLTIQRGREIDVWESAWSDLHAEVSDGREAGTLG